MTTNVEIATAAAKSMTTDVKSYLREWAMPHVLCPGCAHGIVLKSFIRAIDMLVRVRFPPLKSLALGMILLPS